LRSNIMGDRLGHFTAKCRALDQAGVGNRLSFNQAFEQTEIPEILQGLDAAVREYPVVRRGRQLTTPRRRPRAGWS